MAPSLISSEEGIRLEDMPSKTNITSIVAKIRDMLFGDLILFHYLFGNSPVSRLYLQDCEARYAELEEIGGRIELGLRTYIKPIN